VQYYAAQLHSQQPEKPYQQQSLYTEQETDDIFNEEIPDFLNTKVWHKGVRIKKTRYMQLQGKCRDYGMMILIYYLHFKEYWQVLYNKFKKKWQRILCFFVRFN
jgi:hypothetical protein